MATTQYIGARYVPLFADPLEWDKDKEYEPLTIVSHQGNSYTSRQYVPTGIDIDDEKFWALTGNYNAQIEQYRKEVTAYDDRIGTIEDSFDELVTGYNSISKTVDGLGTAAVKNATESVSSGSDDLVTSGAVYDAIDNISSEVTTDLGTAAKKDFTDTVTRESEDLVTAKGVIDYLERKKNVILIGDSYADSQGEDSKSRFDINLPKVASNWNVKSYADSGSGFTFGGSAGRNFSKQIDYARENTENYEDIDVIIIAGGRNEAGGQMSQKRPDFNNLKNSAVSCFKNAMEKFPNAEVYMFACLYDWKLPNFNLLNAEAAIRQAARETDVHCSEKAWSLGIGHEKDMYGGGTDIHPNEAGSLYMCKWMYNAVETGNMNLMRYQYAAVNNTNFAITDQGIQISGQQNMAGNDSVNKLFSVEELPDFLKPKEMKSEDPSTGSGGTFDITYQMTVFIGLNNNTVQTTPIWFNKTGMSAYDTNKRTDPIRYNVVLPYTLG